MNPDLDDVLDALVSHLQGLDLQLAGLTVPVAKAKQPFAEEGQTPLTQFTVCAAQRPKDPVRRWTSIHDLHTYRLQVVFWTPGNRQRLTNLPELAALEDAVQQGFNKKPPDLFGFDHLRDVRASTGVFLDRAAFLDQWDASATDVEVQIVRER